MRFVTPIKHANVNPHGRICHSVLDRDWTVETSLHDVLSWVYGLLLTPETSDPVDTHLAQLFFKADGSYEAAILAHVKAHAAMKSLAEWKAKLGGPDDDEEQGQAQAMASGDSGDDSQPRRSKRLGGREQDEEAQAAASGDSEDGGDSQQRRSKRLRGGA